MASPCPHSAVSLPLLSACAQKRATMTHWRRSAPTALACVCLMTRSCSHRYLIRALTISEFGTAGPLLTLFCAVALAFSSGADYVPVSAPQDLVSRLNAECEIPADKVDAATACADKPSYQAQCANQDSSYGDGLLAAAKNACKELLDVPTPDKQACCPANQG